MDQEPLNYQKISQQKLTADLHSILSLEVADLNQMKLKAQKYNQYFPHPITSYKQLRCRVQATPCNTLSMDLTKDEDTLQKKLAKELNKSSQLKTLLLHLQNATTYKEKSPHKKHRRRAQKRRKPKHRHCSDSSNTSETNSTNSDSEYSN